MKSNVKDIQVFQRIERPKSAGQAPSLSRWQAFGGSRFFGSPGRTSFIAQAPPQKAFNQSKSMCGDAPPACSRSRRLGLNERTTADQQRPADRGRFWSICPSFRPLKPFNPAIQSTYRRPAAAFRSGRRTKRGWILRRTTDQQHSHIALGEQAHTSSRRRSHQSAGGSKWWDWLQNLAATDQPIEPILTPHTLPQ